jgi:hypothetical protein
VAADLEQAIVRVPMLIAVLGLIGAGVAWHFGGLPYAGSFLAGAGAAYLNFRLIERFVKRLLRALSAEPLKPPKAAGFRLFLQLSLFVLAAFVILRFSGLNVVVALYGFLVCPAAVLLEAIYYLVLTYGHS